MRMMYLPVGYDCNHNCFFCPCGNKKERIGRVSENTLIDAIDYAVNHHGINGITVSGGEPTLHPGFRNILRHCNDLNLQVAVLTNGENFYKKEKAAELFRGVECRSVQIITALHSFKAPVHEKLNGVKGSFNRTVEGLKNLMDMGISVSVKQIVCRQNYEDMPEFVDFAVDVFGKDIGLEFTGMDFCGMDRDHMKEVAVGFREIGKMLEKALDRVDLYRTTRHAFPQVMVTDMPLCSVDPFYWRYFLASSKKGTASYAMPEAAGNKIRQLEDLEGDCGTYYNACSTCLMNEQCPGVWRTTAEFFSDEGIHSITG